MSNIYQYGLYQNGLGGSNYYLIVTSNAGGITLNVPDEGGTNHDFNLTNDAARSLANALGRYLTIYGDQTTYPPTSVTFTDAASGLTLQPAFTPSEGLQGSIVAGGNTIPFQFLNSDVQAFANALSHYLATWQ